MLSTHPGELHNGLAQAQCVGPEGTNQELNYMGEKLRSGDKLPSFTLNLVGGGTVTLPQDLPTDFGVMLFYRGHW